MRVPFLENQKLPQTHTQSLKRFRERKKKNVRRNRAWPSRWGTKSLAKESPSCPFSLSLSLSLSLFIFILNPSIFFFLTFCLYFCLIRVLWLSPRPVQMAPSIWWSGSASFLANLGSVLLFLFIYLFFCWYSL